VIEQKLIYIFARTEIYEVIFVGIKNIYLYLKRTPVSKLLLQVLIDHFKYFL